ncbi:transposase [Limnoglobus roseus]|uniref:IS630 family transposase n=1 Tax=Limnoglobus roseus TaxID=2598579 RepID=A0A5C1AF04_9BACT|nr:transposase [Limnoglobus roseus]QEL15578.1 IS630 family transposase [Limnoglobus roseus]
MNEAVSRAYVEKQPVRALKPGDIVVMDNLSSRKVTGVREAIVEARATVVYLPPYSPDLNPIEHVFAKAKNELRAAVADEGGVRCVLWRGAGLAPGGRVLELHPPRRVRLTRERVKIL